MRFDHVVLIGTRLLSCRIRSDLFPQNICLKVKKIKEDVIGISFLFFSFRFFSFLFIIRAMIL